MHKTRELQYWFCVHYKSKRKNQGVEPYKQKASNLGGCRKGDFIIWAEYSESLGAMVVQHFPALGILTQSAA